MRWFFRIVLVVMIFDFLFAPRFVTAEDKSAPGGIIPKLPKTADDPELINGTVYPNWGPVCQRYTYSVIYRDKEGRKPEYVKIYFNGKMIEMQPAFADSAFVATTAKEAASAGKKDYQRGVKYEYKFVPNKLGSNFYYFEASNGLGKARASIIDSPDNGPVLFKSAFDKNEIAVVDKQTNKKILRFSTGREWVGGIALSDDGKYLAAKTSQHVYLFDTAKPKAPIWTFTCEQCGIGNDVKGGIAISGDGDKIVAAFGERVALFDKSSKTPIWKYTSGNAYNVAISKDGQYLAAATSGDEGDQNSNLLILWSQKSQKPLWRYHASGNFHDVSLSRDGSLITGSTGCPDRRFYLFSRDSNTPVIKSDPLTRDSPVHRAKISAEGDFAAVGSESDAGAVFLFSKDKGQVWKFPTPGGSSVRALNFTPDGKYIGAATFGGQAYIFDRQSNQPVASWTVNNTALGGVDIADDGSFIAVGGTDNKLHLFDRDKKEGTEIPFDEYLEEIDISANGKYVAAGTGGSVYFFESFDEDTTPVVCTKVTEPEDEVGREGDCGFGQRCDGENQTRKTYVGFVDRLIRFIKKLFAPNLVPLNPTENGEAQNSAAGRCGDDLCEPNFGETKETCESDCTQGD